MQAVAIRCIALDQIIIRTLVDHDPMQGIGIHGVVANGAVGAFLGQNDTLLTIMMGNITLDQQVIRTGMRVDSVACAMINLVAANHQI